MEGREGEPGGERGGEPGGGERRPDLVVVGDVMLDVVVHAGALAVGGDVPGAIRLRPAGAGANSATWAAVAGARVRLFGRVGDDPAGRLVADELAARGVEAVLARDLSAPTGTMLVVHQGDERSMVADRGANARLAPTDLPPRLVAGAVLISGYCAYDRGSAAAFAAALERAEASYVAVDPASWPLLRRYGAERFLRAARRANVLLANQREAEVLTGADEPRGSARALAGSFAIVCVKRGAAGATMAAGGRILDERALPIESRDPSGAGDAFDGTFLASLAGGAPPEEALRAASAAGARAAASPEAWPEPPDVPRTSEAIPRA